MDIILLFPLTNRVFLKVQRENENLRMSNAPERKRVHSGNNRYWQTLTDDNGNIYFTEFKAFHSNHLAIFKKRKYAYVVAIQNPQVPYKK